MKLLKMRKYLSEKLPWLGVWRRFVRIFMDSLRRWTPHISYSQHREDLFVYNEVKYLNLKSAIYVDVGANHPSSLSNTYFFYKMGLSGVIVEPNKELQRLFRKFRSRDTLMEVGCGATPAVKKFNVSKTPVLSSFSDLDAVWNVEYVPVMPLDLILNSISFEWIFFLSIDVEGADYDCLCGAENTLGRTLYLCIEANDEVSSAKITNYLQPRNFNKIKKIGCNIIFCNEALHSKIQLYNA